MFPSKPLADAINNDRIRAAEAARLARTVADDNPHRSRRRRRPLRAVARIALAALR